MKNKDLPPITSKQLQILLLLYKFRFLNTNQIRKLLNHKNPTRIQQWLKNLREKEYVMYRDYNPKSFTESSIPAVYFLTKLSREKLKDNEKCDISVLNRVYRENKALKPFVDKHIFVADIFINLMSQKDEDEIFKFYTPPDMVGFDYLPNPLPDAYFVYKKENKKRRYFLFLLKETAPMYQITKWIKDYLEYINDNSWSNYTKDPLPPFLIICKNEYTKKKVNETISEIETHGRFYLTTKAKILQTGFNNAWQKLE